MISLALTKGEFDLDGAIQKLHHYLPTQNPLKDFIHHNTLHSFQEKPFFEALKSSEDSFGYNTLLSLKEYRSLYNIKKIDQNVVLDYLLTNYINDISYWQEAVFNKEYTVEKNPQIGQLRSIWKSQYKVNLDFKVFPILFRLLSSYLDQGISIRRFPTISGGFIKSLRHLDNLSAEKLFTSERARSLFNNDSTKIETLLTILVGDPKYFEQYLFDLQMSHPGWSGMVCQIENNPSILYDQKEISLKDLIFLELCLEVDLLDEKYGTVWKPISYYINDNTLEPLFTTRPWTEYDEVRKIWQTCFEITFYNNVIHQLSLNKSTGSSEQNKSMQVLTCIDDRECSFRRHIEDLDTNSETFGLAGFFGVPFYYQPLGGKFYTKHCPDPVTPKHLIKEVSSTGKHKKERHLSKLTHSFLGGWLFSHTVGFWSAVKLMLNTFYPSLETAPSNRSDKHMHTCSKLGIDHDGQYEGDLPIGFNDEEMADIVGNTLTAIGLVKDFAPLIYVVGHGSTSANNTHYAGYDCGACCGRPGSVNARVFSHMANKDSVRLILKSRNINIQPGVRFIGALHDTCRDELTFYDVEGFSLEEKSSFDKQTQVLSKALELNAIERAKKFDLVDDYSKPSDIIKNVRSRSVSVFEPRPELNHATNAMIVVGRRGLSKGVNLDRRSFLHSYDYSLDPQVKCLTNILNAITPVCGGINLEYFFSRVDNHKLGAGTKLAHSVVGLFGVANGIDGDLRTGLPSQMIEIHDPIRLLVVVENTPEATKAALNNNAVTKQWYDQSWINLVTIDPTSREVSQYVEGAFIPYKKVIVKSTKEEVSWI
jgi:uncharacterized protein